MKALACLLGTSPLRDLGKKITGIFCSAMVKLNYLDSSAKDVKILI